MINTLKTKLTIKLIGNKNFNISANKCNNYLDKTATMILILQFFDKMDKTELDFFSMFCIIKMAEIQVNLYHSIILQE